MSSLSTNVARRRQRSVCFSSARVPDLVRLSSIGFASRLGTLPGAFDPASLLEAHQTGVERALVEREGMIRYLFQPGGESVRVLRPHRRQRPHHDEVEGPLQQFDPVVLFTGHLSGVDHRLHWGVK